MAGSICCVCGISALHRSYVETRQLTSYDRLHISRILTNEIEKYFEYSYNICAICLEKVNSIIQAIREMRKKCISTLTLLKEFYDKPSVNKWSVFQKSSIAKDLLKSDKTIQLLKNVESIFIDDKCVQCRKTKIESNNQSLNGENTSASSEDYFTDIEWLSDLDETNLLEKKLILENDISDSQSKIVNELAMKCKSKRNIEKYSKLIQNRIRVNKRGYVYTTDSLNHISKNGDGRFVCLFCKSTFKYQYKAEIHIRLKHTSERPFKCQNCLKTFAASHHLRRHILNVHEDKKFTCSLCKKGFSRRYELTSHEKTHTDIPNVLCPIEKCKKKFFDKFTMKRHFVNSHAEKKFICNQCGKGFRRNYALVMHYKKIHHLVTPNQILSKS